MRRTAILLAAAMAGFGLSCSAPGGRTIYAEFQDVGDLVPLADVQQSDAEVGVVSNIELVQREAEWFARVTLELEEGTPVPRGTEALIRSTSLLGEKFVALIPPEDAGPRAPQIPDGGTIPLSRTGNVPELETAFEQLGGILASGALEDLSAFTSSMAVVVEGQEQQIGEVFDGTAKLVSSLASQREALAEGLERLLSASRTLSEGNDTIDRFVDTSRGAVGILADQRDRLAEVIVQLDRVAAVSADLMRRHKADTSAQLKALQTIVAKVHEVRSSLEAAVGKLPDFTELFARAGPGDYIQLDIEVEGLPSLAAGGGAGTVSAASPSAGFPAAGLLWEATR